MLNRFWLLSKKPHLPLISSLMECHPKLITLCFNWEGTSLSYKIQLPVLLFLDLHSILCQQISFFYNFLELQPTLSEKCFCHKFFNAFNVFSCIHPIPLNSQNLLSVTGVFGQLFLKYLLKIFFSKICWQIDKFVELLLYICFKGPNYRFFGVLFRTYLKNSYSDTSISNYL